MALLSNSSTLFADSYDVYNAHTNGFRQGQSEGFWAWDIVDQAMILVIPVVLAILGDNPMQSEIACHVGLTGKFFCRVCKVKGREGAAARGLDDSSDGPRPAMGEPAPARAPSPALSDASAASAHTDSSQQLGKTKRRIETYHDLAERALRFVRVSGICRCLLLRAHALFIVR